MSKPAVNYYVRGFLPQTHVFEIAKRILNNEENPNGSLLIVLNENSDTRNISQVLEG